MQGKAGYSKIGQVEYWAGQGRIKARQFNVKHGRVGGRVRQGKREAQPGRGRINRAPVGPDSGLKGGDKQTGLTGVVAAVEIIVYLVSSCSRS